MKRPLLSFSAQSNWDLGVHSAHSAPQIFRWPLLTMQQSPAQHIFTADAAFDDEDEFVIEDVAGLASGRMRSGNNKGSICFSD